jgi:hypothetical protein
VVTGARPDVVLSAIDKARTDGIVLEEANLLENAPVVQNAGKEPPPPEMAGQPFLAVKILRVSHVERVECPGKGIFGLRDADKMDVVRHEAIGPDFDVISIGALLEPTQIPPEIRFLLKHLLLIVPPLGDLMRVPDDGGAS